MKVQLGIYEIFSRIIPGGLYIIAITQLLTITGVLSFDLRSVDSLSFTTFVVLTVIAYIVGGAFDRFSLVWFRLFEKRGFSARAFAEFKRSQLGEWDILFKDGDWRNLLAVIRTKNLELASELERNNALTIMLRNVSLATLLLMADTLIQFILFPNSATLPIGVLLLVLSVLIVQESVKLRKWFYSSIFETIIAYRVNLEESIKHTLSTAKRSKGMKS